MSQKKRQIFLNRSNLVGTIHTLPGFQWARKYHSQLDAVEVRADLLPHPPSLEDLAALPVPAILTVRRHDEGGGQRISDGVRRELYLELLPSAAAIDLEGRSLPAFADVVSEARKAKRTVIISFHDFAGVPSLRKMLRLASQARDGGADILKIAALAQTPGEVARLLEFMEKASGPLAVMAMGPLGRASRLLFAQSGSVLNYGWLHRPQVPGQWSARDFHAVLGRLKES